MNARVTGLSSWDDTQLRPLEEKLGKESGDKDVPVLVVDVGGGKGRDLKAFHEKFPTLPRQLVLQDRASVLDDDEVKGLDDAIEVMEHDFFTPQPIKGKFSPFTRSWRRNDRTDREHRRTSILPSFRTPRLVR